MNYITFSSHYLYASIFLTCFVNIVLFYDEPTDKTTYHIEETSILLAMKYTIVLSAGPIVDTF